jgi:hypothetical protein
MRAHRRTVQSGSRWLGALTGVAVLGASSAGAAQPKEPVSCGLRAQTMSGFTRLDALASSAVPVSGHYVLRTAKLSPGGSSRNMQSGTFSLSPGEERTLSTLITDAAADQFEAQLVLEWKDGTRTCTSP